MPVFNAHRYLHQSIKSILSQTFVDFEFIIIDDGSSDNSYEIIEYYSNIDKRIKFLKQNNSGISYLLSNNDYVAVGTSTIMIDEDGDEIFEWNAPLSHTEIDFFHLNGYGGAIIFPSSMMRKNIIVDLGGFNENLTGAEDLCLFLRLAEIGRLANLSENLFYYRQHIESICHSQKSTIAENNLSVINYCKLRRGITLSSDAVQTIPSSNVSFNEIYLKWGWWAIKGKRFHTAKKYGLKVIRKDFFSRQAWLIVYFSILKKNVS